jgi:hypothetical protein
VIGVSRRQGSSAVGQPDEVSASHPHLVGIRVLAPDSTVINSNSITIVIK